MQIGTQTIFPGHFPKASENTALSSTVFHEVYWSDGLRTGKLVGNTVKNTTTSEKKKKKRNQRTSATKTLNELAIFHLCVYLFSVWLLYLVRITMKHQTQKSKDKFTIYFKRIHKNDSLSVNCSHSKAWMNRLYKYGVLMEACTAKYACNQIFPMWITRQGIFKGL